MWVGPDGESVIAGLNPGSYNGNIDTDLSAPLPAARANVALTELDGKIAEIRARQQRARQAGQPFDRKDAQELDSLRREQGALAKAQKESDLQRYQGDWAARVEQNGKISGLLTDYHYYGTGDTGGAPREDSVKKARSYRHEGQREPSACRTRRVGRCNLILPRSKLAMGRCM